MFEQAILDLARAIVNTAVGASGVMSSKLTLIAAVVASLVVVSLAGAADPSATLLVLQPEDTAGSGWSVQTAPQLTTNDGATNVSATKYGRLSGAA